MPSESTFGVYPRRLKSGKTVFYYWAYASSGKRIYKTTGVDSYEKAIRYCRDLLKFGKLVNEKRYTFSCYTSDFFLYDICPYIRTRLLHGKSYTKSWAMAQRNLLLSRIFPEFGDFDIREIYEDRIESWLYKLKQEGVGTKTLNHLITILRIIFGYALKSRDIDENPMEHIELFALKSAEKGILSREELKRLFIDESASLWDSKMHYTLNLTAAITGMRLGELLALRFNMIQPSYITVAYSWNTLDKLKCTKNGKVRKIPIPDMLYRLLCFLGENKESTDFVFSSGKKPIDHKTVYKYFYRALEKIGLSKTIREEKNITFHSFRHGFNTMLLESGIAPETVRLLTGHSAGMTARYSHVQLANMNYSLPF